MGEKTSERKDVTIHVDEIKTFPGVDSGRMKKGLSRAQAMRNYTKIRRQKEGR